MVSDGGVVLGKCSESTEKLEMSGPRKEGGKEHEKIKIDKPLKYFQTRSATARRTRRNQQKKKLVRRGEEIRIRTKGVYKRGHVFRGVRQRPDGQCAEVVRTSIVQSGHLLTLSRQKVDKRKREEEKRKRGERTTTAGRHLPRQYEIIQRIE